MDHKRIVFAREPEYKINALEWKRNEKAVKLYEDR